MAKADSEKQTIAELTSSRLGPDRFSSARVSLNEGSPLAEIIWALDRNQPGDPRTPERVCPALYSFSVSIDGALNQDDRAGLWPFATRLLDSKVDSAAEQARAFQIADWAVREVAPLAFEFWGQTQAAESLRALAPLNKETADTASLVLHEAARAAGSQIQLVASAEQALHEVSGHAINSLCRADDCSEYGAFSSIAEHFAGAAAAEAAEAAGAAESSGVDSELLSQISLNLLDRICPAQFHKSPSSDFITQPCKSSTFRDA